MFMITKAVIYEPSNSQNPKPQYTLTELLAVSDYSKVDPKEDSVWTSGKALGEELL